MKIDVNGGDKNKQISKKFPHTSFRETLYTDDCQGLRSYLMQNFIFQNTTKLVFGKGQIASLSQFVAPGTKLMLTFGGGSVKKNGVYDQVMAALTGYDVVEFWGIEPNPSVETVRKAVQLGREEKIDMLLAVGGGSVLDATKLIAAGLAEPETDPWAIVLRRSASKQIPFASVMTLPATGSEMNNGAVISCRETKEKYGFFAGYPTFSILDPMTTYSLSKTQKANSMADIVVHVLEQYMTTTGQSRVLDHWAEGVMQTIFEIAPQVLADEPDYDVMSDYMYSATMALNNFLRMGITQDWATHQIGHELTALCGVTHGESLAIVYPGLLSVLREQKKGKILQFADRVLRLTEGSEEDRIETVIRYLESFFKSLGLATRLSEKGIGVETVEAIATRFTERGVHFGEAQNVDGELARKILLERL
jgi:NADP-dependent alcohol dehydrogenase